MNDPSGASVDWVDAAEAMRILGVKRQTLYAYVSRGLLRSTPVAGTRRRRYARADLMRLSARREARSGHRAVAAGALRWGEPVMDSAITMIEPTGHRYRGLRALDLADDGYDYEAVAELMWTGELPKKRVRWKVDRLGVGLSRLAALLPGDARPIDATAVAVNALALADRARFDPAGALPRARIVLRRLVACLALPYGRERVEAALDAGSVARSFLVALGGRTSAAAVRATNDALILMGDHELNPSSFAARVPASVGADLYASLSAAIATMSGPIHGGACDRVEALLAEVQSETRAFEVVRDRLRRGDLIAGFGHRLYPDGDPRAAPLLARARALAPRDRTVRAAEGVVSVMEVAGQEHPTCDFALVALCAALRLPPGSATALFSAGRAAGWVAHVLEQRDAGFSLRPRARYVGPPPLNLESAG